MALGEIAWFEQNIVKDRDMPEFPNAQSMVAEAALVRAKGCRVLLDGEGGDEFAGGSYYYIHEMLREGRLGGVDKFEPVSGGGEMDHSEEAVGQLIVSGGDGAVDFELPEHALDAVALLV